MPICSYGGARCQAGPGASGPADTVHEHEVKYHGKRDRTGNANRSRPRMGESNYRAPELEGEVFQSVMRARWLARQAANEARRREK